MTAIISFALWRFMGTVGQIAHWRGDTWSVFVISGSHIHTKIDARSRTDGQRHTDSEVYLHRQKKTNIRTWSQS